MKPALLIILFLVACGREAPELAKHESTKEITKKESLVVKSPSPWLLDHWKVLVKANQRVNEKMKEALETYFESVRFETNLNRVDRVLRSRQEAMAGISDSLSVSLEAVERLSDGIKEGRGDTDDWLKVGDGVRIKILPGWIEKPIASRSAIIGATDLSPDMASYFKDSCYLRFKQPLLIWVDTSKVEAYKFDVRTLDRFGVPATGGVAREDRISRDISVLALTIQDSDFEQQAEEMNKRLEPFGFDIPVEVSNVTIIYKKS